MSASWWDIATTSGWAALAVAGIAMWWVMSRD